MASNFKILPFTTYVLRAPLLPLSLYLNTVEDYSVEKTKLLYQNPLIREAINLASPILIKQLDKWVKADSQLSVDKSKKLALTFLKYLARMTSRCTPFGLFSGCSVGRIATETKIILEVSDKFKRVTQFDMQFWVLLLQEISSKKEVIPHLRYYANNSIYKIGDFYRYIEYKNIDNKREHSITALRESTVLTELLNEVKSGKTIEEIIAILADNEAEKEEANEFVLKLIKFQFLVSELDTVVTGNKDWERIWPILQKNPDLKKDYLILERIKKQLSSLDETLVPTEIKYKGIKNNIKRLGIGFDDKYLFQTDLNLSASVNTLSQNVHKKVLQAIYFLNRIQVKKEFQNQENFKKAFIQRYEYRSMPLTTVLDTEIGIGYLQKQDINDSHDILEFLTLKPKEIEEKNQIWTFYDYVLQGKIQKCLLKGDEEIVLTEKDFVGSSSDLTNTPVTFSVMIEVFDQDRIAIGSFGNNSAVKLLGRFCNGDPDIHNLTKEIVQKEEDYYSDKIMAEIVHIPESRTGNILRRPVLRNYEISYLAKSGVSEGKNIDLSDLFISIQNDTIKLHSKEHNKEVIPCLSNAHNFSKNSLPIYHFLCDLQAQHSKPIYSFDWGALESHYDFFPRVIYQEIILSKAKWIVKKEEISFLYNINNKNVYEEFLNWKSTRNISRYVNWVNGDNTLLLDFATLIGMEMFLKSVQNISIITLEEFLFTKESAVQNRDSDNFCNQFVLSFHKE